MVITEVGCMGVKPGIDIMNRSTPEGAIISDLYKMVATESGGPNRIYWGLERENPSNLWAFFDWDSVTQHRDFAKAHGERVVEDMSKICINKEFSKHLTMVPSSDVLCSPVTGVILAYFPADTTPSKKDELSQQMQDILTEYFHGPEVKIAYGWSLENEIEVPSSQGLLGTLLKGFVGVPSLDGGAFENARTAVVGISGIIGFGAFSVSFDHMERGA
ncbi:hypothetical protein S40288_00982 [Stachybotrys chartarum IBT 40288]|nr:hypothetical protein S40288_00982 [Stachybotrys chartarum IBT 40288]